MYGNILSVSYRIAGYFISFNIFKAIKYEILFIFWNALRFLIICQRIKPLSKFNNENEYTIAPFIWNKFHIIIFQSCYIMSRMVMFYDNLIGIKQSSSGIIWNEFHVHNNLIRNEVLFYSTLNTRTIWNTFHARKYFIYYRLFYPIWCCWTCAIWNTFHIEKDFIQLANSTTKMNAY